MNGNNTKNQDTPANPLLHNQFRMKVQRNAKTNLTNTAKIATPLNKATTQARTARTKYILAGVQSLLNSLFII